LQTARLVDRDTRWMLSKCSERLAATQQALNTTETRLENATDALRGSELGRNKLARRMEEYATEIKAALQEARDSRRMLSECSERLAGTQHALNITETKLNETLPDKTGGKGVEKTSDFAESTPGVHLEEVHCRPNKHAEEMMKSGSIHVTLERQNELGTAATATECLPHTNWLQQRLEVAKQVCSSDESRNGTEAEHGGETATGPKETFNSADEQDCSCSRQLTEAQANITVQEEMLRNCTELLAMERVDKRMLSVTASGCASELKWSTQRLKTKTATLTQCEGRLQHMTLVLPNAVNRCRRRSKSKPKIGIGDGSISCELAKSTGDRTKLARCTEKLTTAEDAVRWKTKQQEKCAERLLKATASLAEASSVHETDVENLELRHREKLANIITELRLRHQRELEEANAGCEIDSPLIPITKTIFVMFLICIGYVWSISVVHYLLLLLPTNYSHWFRTLIGIRSRLVEYRVNFMNRYRHFSGTAAFRRRRRRRR